MRRQKITMVDPWQITSRGWKAFRTPKSVEKFTNQYHVHHVYWRTPGKKPILLVDFNHFKECYQDFRKTTPKPMTTQHATPQTKARRRPTVGKTQTKSRTKTRTKSQTQAQTKTKPTYRTGTRRTTTRRTTWSNRPKTRYGWSNYRRSN